MTESKHSDAVQTDQPISSYIRIESLLLSTASADAYRAFDLGQRQACCLWISRVALPRGSADILQFLRRFEAIDLIDPPICVIGGYGVDSEGRAFALYPPLDGYKVGAGNLEGAEAERRMTSCLRLVAILHERGIVCGDLGEESFWVTRDGDVLLIGLLGLVSQDVQTVLQGAPSASRVYLAPEVLLGAAPTPASDVFSLGVLGYYLLTGKHPYGASPTSYAHDAQPDPLSSHLPAPPIWAEEVLLKSLQVDPRERFQSAVEMLALVKGIRERTSANESMPVPRRKSAAAIRASEHAAPHVRSTPEQLAPLPIQKRTSGPQASQFIFLLLIAVLVGGVALAFLPSFSNNEEEERLGEFGKEFESIIPAGEGGSLGQDISEIADPNVELEEKEKRLKNLSLSNDAVAHVALMKSAMEAPTEKFRTVSEKYILERASRQGLVRSAEQVRQWLRTLRPREYPPAYEPILQVLDRALPIEERFAALRRAYSTNPIVGLRLATALAFDLESLDEFRTLLSQLVGDSLHLEDAEERATISLIMAHQDLSVVFGEDVLQYREQVPDNDITWLLRHLAAQRDVHVRAIANLALDRKIISPVRSLFLEIVRDRADLDASIITALIRGAAGNLTTDDIATFGRWYDIDAEKVLLALLVDVHDPKLVRQTVETLAAKSIVTEPSASLLEWVRDEYWDEREKFGQLIGVLGNLERIPEKHIAENLKIMDSIVRDSDLLEILIESDHPEVIRTIVKKFSDLLGLGTLLKLLDNRDKTVRMDAVRALKGFNDLGALKIIIDHYKREKDEDVKNVYRETFWVIKRREENGEGQFGGL